MSRQPSRLTLLVVSLPMAVASIVSASGAQPRSAPGETAHAATALPDAGTAPAMGPEFAINLMNYGADNSGLAGSERSNYDAFQRAIAELCKRRNTDRFCGGIIWLPPGIYNLNQTISIVDEIIIRGSGVASEVEWTGPRTAAANGGVQPIAFNFTGAPHRYTNNAGMQDLMINSPHPKNVNEAASGLSVAISFAPEIAPETGFKPPLGFPLRSILTNVHIYGFGTGVRIGVLHGNTTTVPWGFTITNLEVFACTIGVDLQSGSAIDFYNLRAEGCMVGFWHESGFSNLIVGGVLQGDMAALVVTGCSDFRVEGLYFEANYGGELIGGEIVSSETVPPGVNLIGGSIVLQAMLPGAVISGFTAADCTFSAGPAHLPDGGVLETASNVSLVGSDEYCSMDDIHFENLIGMPHLNFSPACNDRFYAGGPEGGHGHSGTFSVVNSPAILTRDHGPYWKGNAKWKPIPVFEISGYGPDGGPFMHQPYGIPSVKVQDNGTLDVRATNLIADGGYLEPAIIAYGIDDVSALSATPHAGTFHALDLRHGRTDSCNNGPNCQSVPGDKVDVRFMVNGFNGYGWNGDDKTSSAMIQVVNTGAASDNPSPGHPALFADMAFSTAGPLPGKAQLSNEGEVERMRITHDGKVGIGTDAPKATLDVAGTLRLQTPRSPKSTEPCSVGELAWDGAYVYVCVAANAWKRSALSSY